MNHLKIPVQHDYSMPKILFLFSELKNTAINNHYLIQ